MNDSPFSMQPQRRPMGLFRSPGLNAPGNINSSPITGGGGFPSSPTAPIRPGRESAAPGMTTAPVAPAPATSPTPLPNVPQAAGPYNYSGPTMSLLGMTDFMPPAASAGPAAPFNPGARAGGVGGGGGALDSIFAGGGGRRMLLS